MTVAATTDRHHLSFISQRSFFLIIYCCCCSITLLSFFSALPSDILSVSPLQVVEFSFGGRVREVMDEQLLLNSFREMVEIERVSQPFKALLFITQSMRS